MKAMKFAALVCHSFIQKALSDVFAVVSLRSKVDRIQLWTRSKTDIEKLNGIGKKLVKILDITEADNVGLEFQVSHHLFRSWKENDGSLSITPMTTLLLTNSYRCNQTSPSLNLATNLPLGGIPVDLRIMVTLSL